MSRSKPNRLIVEGYDDLNSVVGLMSAHIDWPDGVADAPVYIEIGNGAEEILVDGYLTSILKTHGVRIVGVLLDADTKPKGRYQRIRTLCRSVFPNLPADLPKTGLIVDNDNELRLGVWIMPDNESEGSLETFLKYLVPNRSETIWKHACGSVVQARELGATCHEAHVEKANLYTWLSWQDPPGQKPGIALTKKMLDPHSAYASAFVDWFRDLYRL